MVTEGRGAGMNVNSAARREVSMATTRVNDLGGLTTAIPTVTRNVDVTDRLHSIHIRRDPEIIPIDVRRCSVIILIDVRRCSVIILTEVRRGPEIIRPEVRLSEVGDLGVTGGEHSEAGGPKAVKK
jgi:hypothetical protein